MAIRLPLISRIMIPKAYGLLISATQSILRAILTMVLFGRRRALWHCL